MIKVSLNMISSTTDRSRRRSMYVTPASLRLPLLRNKVLLTIRIIPTCQPGRGYLPIFMHHGCYGILHVRPLTVVQGQIVANSNFRVLGLREPIRVADRRRSYANQGICALSYLPEYYIRDKLAACQYKEELLAASWLVSGDIVGCL